MIVIRLVLIIQEGIEMGDIEEIKQEEVPLWVVICLLSLALLFLSFLMSFFLIAGGLS